MGALHEAIATGDYATAKRLLADGADVNERDRIGASPLHLAAMRGHAEIARLLIDRGADQYSEVHGGDTPLAAAIAAGHDHVAQLLGEARTECWSVADLRCQTDLSGEPQFPYGDFREFHEALGKHEVRVLLEPYTPLSEMKSLGLWFGPSHQRVYAWMFNAPILIGLCSAIAAVALGHLHILWWLMIVVPAYIASEGAAALWGLQRTKMPLAPNMTIAAGFWWALRVVLNLAMLAGLWLVWARARDSVDALLVSAWMAMWWVSSHVKRMYKHTALRRLAENHEDLLYLLYSTGRLRLETAAGATHEMPLAPLAYPDGTPPPLSPSWRAI